MVNEGIKASGYIYKGTNDTNGKVYIGKTEKTIEKRWKKHIDNANELKRAREANPQKKIPGTHLDNALIKYGADSFSVTQIDIAYSKAELNKKEKNWIKKYDSMNREKGYNMTEGGEGGKLSLEVIEKLRNIAQEKAKDPEWHEKVRKGVSDKYQNDPEYKEKQTKERRERTKNPEWVEKMTKINQERAKNPEWVEKMTKINQERAKDPNFINKMREIGKQTKKEIKDKREFLNDIKNNMEKKEMLKKYEIGKTAYNKRIQEMFGPNGPKNYTELKNHLQNKDINDVLKDIKKREAETQVEKSENKTDEKIPEEENQGSKEIDRDSIDDKNSKEEINEGSVEGSQEEEVDEIREKPEEEAKDEKEKVTPEAQIAEPKDPPEEISTEEPDNQQQTQIEEPSDSQLNEPLEKSPIGNSFEPILIPEPDGKKTKGEKNYDDMNGLIRDPGPHAYIDNKFALKPPKDYSGIDRSRLVGFIDNGWIPDNINIPDKDYNGLDEDVQEKGNDFDGIDSPQERGDKDFDNIDDDGDSEGRGESGGES